MRWLITGANGHLGRQIVSTYGHEHQILALVRSESAAQSLHDFPCDVLQIDYQDPERTSKEIASRFPGAWDALIGLTGTIRGNRAEFYAAHEAVSDWLVSISRDLEIHRIVSLSIFGADVGSSNECFASRGEADNRLLASGLKVAILRLPMILGPRDYASLALRNKGSARLVFSFRVTSLEQPIAASDVMKVVESMIERKLEGVYALGGPEILSRRALILRAGASLGRRPLIVNVPLVLGKILAKILSKLMSSPPITPSMLGVLDHDDVIDNAPLEAALGVSLEPLDETLRSVLNLSENKR